MVLFAPDPDHCLSFIFLGLLVRNEGVDYIGMLDYMLQKLSFEVTGK